VNSMSMEAQQLPWRRNNFHGGATVSYRRKSVPEVQQCRGHLQTIVLQLAAYHGFFCLFICVCIYMYAYTHIHTNTYTYTYIYILFICACLSMYTYITVYVSSMKNIVLSQVGATKALHKNIYVRICIYMYIYVYI
jgi:hypothetical protein